MNCRRSPSCSPGRDRQNLPSPLHRPWLRIPRTAPWPPSVIQRTQTAAVSRPTSLLARRWDISSLLDIWWEDIMILLCWISGVRVGYHDIYYYVTTLHWPRSLLESCDGVSVRGAGGQEVVVPAPQVGGWTRDTAHHQGTVQLHT